MNDFLNFIITNKRLIFEVVILIVSVVVFILRKKPVNDIMSYIYTSCLSAVSEVEKSSIIGSQQKLVAAIEIVVKSLKSMFPDLTISKTLMAMIISTIEAILSTPQKKGVDGNAKT